MKNKYIVRWGISKAKFREILKYFCMDIEAVKIAPSGSEAKIKWRN